MNTKLKEAAEQGDLKLLVRLLDQGADVNALSSRRERSALIEASSNGHVQCVQELIKRGADLDHEDGHGMTALTYAMQKGHALCLQALVFAWIKRHGNGDAIRQLGAYAEAGDFGKIRSFVEDSKSLQRWTDSEKSLFLFLLLTFPCPHDISEDVIKISADVNARIQNVLSPFLYAVIQAKTQCLDVLLRHRLDFIFWSSKIPGTDLSIPATAIRKECDLIERTFDNIHPNLGTVLKAKTVFMFAAQSGDGFCLESLLNYCNHQVDLNEKDSEGLTSLMYAAMSRSPACVRVLLDNGADTDLACKEGKTALMYAAISGCEESLSLLLKNGSKSNNLDSPEVDRKGMSALMYASMFGHSECADVLIRHGASVNLTNKLTGQTVLMFALQNGNLDYVKRLIRERANVHCVDLIGNSALIYAVLGRSVDCVREILRHGCYVDHEARDSHTALWWAIKQGELDMVELLVEEGGQFRKQWMAQSMYQAARIGEPTSVRILINFGADATGSFCTGKSLIMHAALRGNVETVKLLLDNGANMHERCKNDGKSVLMHAAEGGNVECVDLLLQRRATIKEVDNFGRTALMLASQGGYAKCVDLMLDRCHVNVNQTDNMGRTALIHAVRSGFHVERCVAALLDSGADVSCADKEGLTPLMYSAQSGDLDTVSNLLDNGADVEAVDRTGRSAVSHAVIHGNKSCFKRIAEFKSWSSDSRHSLVYVKSIERVFRLCAPKEMYVLMKEGYFRWDWLDNQDWATVKNASFALIKAGIPPNTFRQSTFCQDGTTTFDTSVLKFCLQEEDYETSLFLLDNLYLCRNDIHDLSAIVSQMSAMSWKVCDDRLLSRSANQPHSNPPSLSFLSFLTVSTALRPTTQFGKRKTMVDSLHLPPVFKTILSFQFSDSQLEEE